MRTLLLLSCCAVLGQTLSPSSHLSPADKSRLKTVFAQGLSPSADIVSIHYSVLGYSLLGETIANKEGLCSALGQVADEASVETVAAAAGAGKALGCPIKLGAKASEVIKTSLGDGSTTASIYYAAKAQQSLGAKLDSAAVKAALTAAVKKDDSLLSLGLAFQVAAMLDGDVSSFFDRIEDVVVQADEVDGKMLQFEGGLSVTSVVLTGAVALSTKAKKPLPLTGEQMVKFGSYLISRKSVQQPKGGVHLLEAIETMTNNGQFVPVSVSLASSVSVSADSPVVVVSVTDLKGNSPGDMKVVLDSAKSQDGSSLATKKEMTKVSGSATDYSVDLMSLKPGAGFYDLQLTASPVKSNAKLVGNSGVVVSVKVLTSITVEDAELKVLDGEQSTGGKSFKLTFPQKLGQKVALDYKERIQLSFSVKDSGKKSMLVHQAFVRMTHVKSGSEIVYVAEADNSKVYNFDLDLGAQIQEFQSKSGDYSITVVLGDALLSNPTAWSLGEVSINFPQTEESKEAGVYEAKPEINHVFREPEARPSKMVSNAFTLLCLSPFLLLAILWIKLGVNISNFPFSLTGLGFHAGLGAIFVLYLYFWLQLNMFETVKYLVILGVVTFLCGNSLLASIAKKSK